MTTFLVLRFLYVNFIKYPHFKIRKAILRKWMGSNHEDMITFSLEIKTKKSSDELKFEELWVNEKRYKFRISREGRKIVTFFRKKEIVRLDILSEIKNSWPQNTEVIKKCKKEKVLLGYTFNNKMRYIGIGKLKDSDSFNFA